VANLNDDPLTLDDDFDYSSDTDLGEGDSADEEDNTITRPVSPPNSPDANENEVISPTVNDESSSEDSPPRTRLTIMQAPTPRVSQNSYTWVDDFLNINRIDFNENFHNDVFIYHGLQLTFS